MHPPIEFKTGYRGIMLLHRSKDGEKGNAQRNSIKKISSCPEEYDRIVAELKEIQKTYPTHRIYSSVNARNIEKAIQEFKRRQLDCDFIRNKQWNEFYCDIKNRFFSCFMNPLCRDESNWLIDCDSPEEYVEEDQQDDDNTERPQPILGNRRAK